MSSAKRVESFRRLLEHAHERLKLEFGFRLWDGSRVPADYPRDGLAISFADEGTVAALIRKPKIDTLANLWATARVDVVNGTLLDLVAKRPKARTQGNPRPIAMGHAARHRAAIPVRAARRAVAARKYPHRPAEPARRRSRTRTTSTITTTLPTSSTRSGSTRRWSTPAPISTTGTKTSTRRSGTSSKWSAASFA